MSSLSTHVLDTTIGRPAAGIAVRLEQAGAVLAEQKTDADGRAKGFPELAVGAYRLVFGVAGYWKPAQPAFYSEIVVQFDVTSAREHYHVPLLLAPNGYTTYRGS